MKRALLAVPVLLLYMAAVCVAGTQSSSRYTPGDLIVKLHAPSTDTAPLRATVDANLKRRFKDTGAELWELRSLTVPEAIERLKADPRVEFVEPNYILDAHDVFPDDPYFPQSWGLYNNGLGGGKADADIDATDAWPAPAGPPVVIGVIDTGFDRDHEDLAGSLYTNPNEIPDNGIDDDENGFIDDVHGWDFVFDDNNPNDAHGHGTHVAGIIAARGNNGRGVAGVAWNVRILPIRILNEAAQGDVVNAVRAIEYATRMGLRITNNSWGGFTQSLALRDAIRAAGERGMLFVASSGNNGANSDVNPIFPAAYDFDNIISVGATDRGDNRCFFSNFGASSVDLVAPGSGIVSTFPDNAYGTFSGTSMSAAFVSGAACLLWQRAPALTHLEVKAAILASVDPLPALAAELTSGGRLNVNTLLAGLDKLAPSPVGTLAVQSMSSNTARLSWTAGGDDGASGSARRYDLRYSTSVINAGNFAVAPRVPVIPAPRLAGSLETIEISGLWFLTKYYFALVVEDEAGNRSPLSNVPNGTTLGVPDIDWSPAAFSASVQTGGTQERTLTLTNTRVGTLDFDAVVFPPWARIHPATGRIAAGQSMQVAVKFDAARMPAGFYSSTILLSTNSPGQVSIPVTVSLTVSDAPDIVPSTTTLDFGPRFGSCVFDSVIVTNHGSTTLFVNGVSVTEGPFIVLPASFFLAPGEALPVSVIFCPTEPGRAVATLTIRSNDPDHPEYAVTLKGRTAEPPSMSVSPPSLSANVYEGGVAHRTVTVSNNGGSDLDFEIALVEPEPGMKVDVVGAGGAGEDVVAVGRPLSRDDILRLRASTRGSLVLGSNDDVDGVRSSTSSLAPGAKVMQRVNGARLEEVFGSAEDRLFGSARSRGNIFVCTKATTLREHRFYLAPGASGEIWFLVYEGLARTGVFELLSASDVSPSGTQAGWYSSGEIQMPLRVGRYYLIVASFEQPTNYFADDSITPYPVAASFGELIAPVGITWAPATLFPPFQFQIVTSEAYGPAAAYYQTLITDGVVTWASAGPGAGTVTRGTSVDVDIRLHAALGFPEGNHAAVLRVTGNDPVTPEVLVPVQFQLVAAPDIVLSQPAVAYGSCFVGTQVQDTVVVANWGTHTLHVSNIVSSLPGVTVQPSSFSLFPEQDVRVVVAFTPTTTTPINGTLTIACNDPDEPAVVMGVSVHAVAPPVMNVSPSSLSQVIAPRGRVSRKVTITNSGPSPLSFFVDSEVGAEPVVGGGPKRRPQAVSRDVTPQPTQPRDASAPRYAGEVTGRRDARIVPLPHSTGITGSLDVLIIEGGAILEITGALLGFSDISTLDHFDAVVATPTFDMLDDYDAVLLTSDFRYADVEAMGDALADYVDEGGGVVMTLPSFVFDFEVRGRFLEEGYAPFAVGTGPYDPAVLGRHDEDHPIMAGVQSAAGDYLGAVLLEPNSRWVADWSNGLHLAATRGRRVAALNVLLLDGGFWEGDVPQLVHNALMWVANPAWLVAEPAEGLVPPQQSVDVALTFHADDLVAGSYTGKVHVSGDDPLRPNFVLPVSLEVDSMSVTAVEPGTRPSKYALFESRPNPFNPATTITYELPRASAVELVVYDVAGRQIRELVRATHPAGRHDAVWDGRNDVNGVVASGVYFYRLTAGDFVATKKMILLK